MSAENAGKLKRQVERAAETALAERKFVTAIDVLLGLGWLTPRQVDEWRQGRVDYLERVVIASLGKISTAMRCFRGWAQARGLTPSETGYVARTRGRQPLRFSKSGDPEIEQAYRTHWVSPELSQRKRARLNERQSRPPDLVVISPVKDFACAICDTVSGGLLMMEEPGPVCMSCADIDHLVFLAAGDAALTRRAKANSRLSAVVVRFSRSRGRYERQGILVQESALDRAEEMCLADEDARARRRERAARRRAEEDLELQERMAQEIARLFPGCPAERAEAIARHAAVRGSGRVGRSAAGRALEPDAVELAVTAAVRHQDTRYDETPRAQRLTTRPGRCERRSSELGRADISGRFATRPSGSPGAADARSSASDRQAAAAHDRSLRGPGTSSWSGRGPRAAVTTLPELILGLLG